MTTSALTTLERVVYAFFESAEGQSGAGTPLDRNDPLMTSGQIDIVPGAAVPAALAEELATLAGQIREGDPESEGVEHTFRVVLDGEHLGWLGYYNDADGDCGYVIVDLEDKVLDAGVENYEAMYQLLEDEEEEGEEDDEGELE